jgi:IK cytokine
LCAGDVEHTHLVKGLDYALLHKIRSEIDKVPEDEDNIKQRYFIVEASKIKI